MANGHGTSTLAQCLSKQSITGLFIGSCVVLCCCCCCSFFATAAIFIFLYIIRYRVLPVTDKSRDSRQRRLDLPSCSSSAAESVLLHRAVLTVPVLVRRLGVLHKHRVSPGLSRAAAVRAGCSAAGRRCAHSKCASSHSTAPPFSPLSKSLSNVTF